MKNAMIKSGKYNWPKAVDMDKGPYYFISYCHRNAVMACHDFSRLASFEVPFWYDDGMVPGQDWKEKAESAMSHPNCIGVFFFVTKASLQSFPVFEELKFALKMSAEKSNFSIISIHHGGKSISRWAQEGAIPSDYLPTYSRAFPDDNIFIARKKAIESTEHFPLILDVFNNAGLLKSAYKSVLDRSAFLTEPYKDGYMITSYRGQAANVIIPSRILGKKIIAIGPDAFAHEKALKSVKMENSVLEILDNAFEGCVNLKSITFSDNLQYIGNECFKSCLKLTSVDLPDSLITLGDYAFYQCFNLKRIDFGKAFVSIGYATFSQCVKLENLILSPNTQRIENYAFGGCAFNSLEVPASTLVLGTDCCVCNPNLTHLKFFTTDKIPALPDEIGTLCPHFNYISVPFHMDDALVLELSKLKPVRRRLDGFSRFINDEKGFRWNSIDGAEEYRIAVDDKQFVTTSCQLPFHFKKKVYRIAFCAHSSQKDIEDSEAFFTYTVKMPEIKDNVLVGGKFLDGKVVAKSDIQEIGEGAFSNDLSVTSLEFEGTKIGNKAFGGCLNLEDVKLSNPVEIGDFAFNRCTKLKSIDWDQITSLGEACFEGCANLEIIRLSDKVKVIPAKAFRRCINVTALEWEGAPLEMQADCLRGCMSIEELSLPDSIEKIGAHAISYISIKKLKLPSSLKHYDITNLQSCSYLKKITIQNNDIFTIVEDGLVRDGKILLRYPPAKNVKKVVVPSAITTIEKGAFQDSSFIESLVFERVETIGERAFFASASLKQVTLPETLLKIDSEAFAHCEHLTKVVLKGSGSLEIAPNAFDNRENLTLVVSPQRARDFASHKLFNCQIKIEVQDV